MSRQSHLSTRRSTPRSNWKSTVKDVYDSLDRIRIEYQSGLKNNKIREHLTCLEVFDDDLSSRFNSLRRDCLNKMNTILKEADLDQIDSELLKMRA